MEDSFYQKIANSTAHRPVRDLLSGMVLQDKSLLPALMGMAFTIYDKNHHKAWWIAELVFEAKINWMTEYLDAFCNTLPLYSNESAIRPIAKICLFATEEQRKQPGFLNPAHCEKITEACFDWLIKPNGRVANKAYAMRALYFLGKKEGWIYPELTRILTEDAAQHTAAYRAAAKDILKKIGR